MGTPGLLEINNVNVPKNAPLIVEVSVQSLQCTDSANGCSSSVGGKPEYFDKKEIGGKDSAPTFYSEFVLKLKGNNCCS